MTENTSLSAYNEGQSEKVSLADMQEKVEAAIDQAVQGAGAGAGAVGAEPAAGGDAAPAAYSSQFIGVPVPAGTGADPATGAQPTDITATRGVSLLDAGVGEKKSKFAGGGMFKNTLHVTSSGTQVQKADVETNALGLPLTYREKRDQMKQARKDSKFVQKSGGGYAIAVAGSKAALVSGSALNTTRMSVGGHSVTGAAGGLPRGIKVDPQKAAQMGLVSNDLVHSLGQIKNQRQHGMLSDREIAHKASMGQTKEIEDNPAIKMNSKMSMAM